MNAKNKKGNDILVTYTGENALYKSGKLMYYAGKQNAGQDTVGTIVSPVQAQGVVIDAALPDPVVFSFTWRGKPRQFLVKIQSKGGDPSTCTVRLLAPEAKGEWKSLSGDVTLLSTAAAPLLRNPHGLAQWGNMLYFVDWETRQIVILGANELKGITGEYTPVNTPFDLTKRLSPTNEAKGQSVIALEHRLFALYQDTDTSATTHDPGILVRMDIGSGGLLTYDTQILVGLNPQAIIPVNDGTAVQLLVPAIGGPQDYSGGSNGTDSNIESVPAFGTWKTADVELIGDAYTPPGPPAPTAFDIHAVAAADRGTSSMLYILTMVYDNGGGTAKWRIYRATVAQFLAIGGADISTAVSNGQLTLIDQGTIATPNYAGLYFWDLLYEQLPGNGDAGDRIWAALGSATLVTRAAAGTYGSPTLVMPPLTPNPYVFSGYNGGVNVNSMDLTIEAVNQAKREVSLKRGMRGRPAPRAPEEKEEK